MSKNRSSHTRRITVGIAAAVAVPLLGVATSASAQAAVPNTAHAVADVRPADAAADTKVVIDHFYDDYILAFRNHDTAEKTALRKARLTPAALKSVAVWEKKNDADGILRAQNAPSGGQFIPSNSAGTKGEVDLYWQADGDRYTTTSLLLTIAKGNRMSSVTAKPTAAAVTKKKPVNKAVTAFYKKYIAAYRTHDTKALASLRKGELTAALNRQLTAWSKKNPEGGDPVLRVQNIPASFKVVSTNAAGTEADVKLAGKSGDPVVTHIHINAAHRISALSQVN